MGYSDIRKVEVLTNPSLVNEYLSLGWRLLNIYTTAYDTQPPGSNYQTANYVLGWPFRFERMEPEYPGDKVKSE